MEILRREWDKADRYRVTVTVDGINTMQFKYRYVVDDSVAMIDAERAELARQQEEENTALLMAYMEEEQQLLIDIANGNYKENK